jgi:hypothetical protein
LRTSWASDTLRTLRPRWACSANSAI